MKGVCCRTGKGSSSDAAGERTAGRVRQGDRMTRSRILGISAYYHDSAAAVLVDGEIIAAAQEERFSRIKHDPSFPGRAVAYVLAEAGLAMADLDAVVFYDKPYLKFERLLETYHAYAPRGLKSFVSAIPVWIKEKLFMRRMLQEELKKINPGRGAEKPLLLFAEHHLSHAASAFYPSPFEEAGVLTVDGVGEWATTTIGVGRGRELTILKELPFPHSLGLLYSAFTHYCGFRVNSGEYKLMGLAPYGNPSSSRARRFREKILTELIDLKADGSLLLNMEYFCFATGLTMCHDWKWRELFGISRRQPDSGLDRSYMDLALAVQQVTEEIVLRLGRTAREVSGSPNLVMAGGVALNCVANGRLVSEGIFDRVWIQPAAGDAGGALGAAYVGYHIWQGMRRQPDGQRADAMQGALLGPAFSRMDIARLGRKYEADYRSYETFSRLCADVAALLARGKVVGWFQGRMEYGPRALGNRSILGDPRRPDMQKKLNLKIKYREGFRPFAPSVLAEEAAEYFDLKKPSPYMLLVDRVCDKRCSPLPEGDDEMGLYERLYRQRSDIPAVTHVDYSARIQTVHRETNERYWQLLSAFKAETGCSLLVNTSFNVRGEPIVCTPEDAYRCFMHTEMDYLVMEDCLFDKERQPPLSEEGDWRNSFAPD